jgi:hypothetical protein
MRLVDRVAQSRTPFIVVCNARGTKTRLSGASDYADEVASCPIRYVLSDELTRLCTALAYSKGAQTLACTDLIHIPAQRLWVEWASAPWQDELDRYGFPAGDRFGNCGRRGAFLNASRDGRRGCVRMFWCMGDRELDVFVSAMQARFDFDSPDNDDSCGMNDGAIRVADVHRGGALGTCFSFEFEKTWAEYYSRSQLSAAMRHQIERHSLSTIALDIPVLLTFFLLLNTRSGLPQQRSQLERLNRSRNRSGKAPLLEHIDVLAPFPAGDIFSRHDSPPSGRRRPRLHHVRGHLVRRSNELFWRAPHLRGNAVAGTLKTRTVTWAFDHT